MLSATEVSPLIPNKEFTKLATDEQIQRVSEILESNNIHVIVVETGEEAKRVVLEMLPQGAEVYANQSLTLQKLGLTAEIDTSGRYDAVRPKVLGLDRKTHANQIRVLRARPTYIVGSVHAVTEDGHVLIASNSGSQLGPYASGAGKVIWVIGAQKIVKDLNEGFRRIEDHVVPLEEAHMQELYKVSTAVNKMLIVNKETRPNRITMIIIKEEIGF